MAHNNSPVRSSERVGAFDEEKFSRLKDLAAGDPCEAHSRDQTQGDQEAADISAE